MTQVTQTVLIFTLVGVLAPQAAFCQKQLQLDVNLTHYLPGIDVSHYQGSIDWNKVAASGIKFVCAKATEGLTNVDDTLCKATASFKGIYGKCATIL